MTEASAIEKTEPVDLAALAEQPAHIINRDPVANPKPIQVKMSEPIQVKMNQIPISSSQLKPIAIQSAKNPAQMAYAMNLGVKAGRLTYLAGRMEKKYYATASSPLSDISTLL